ncbi:MAG: hypothetical protein ACOX3Q_14105 [Clostridia bacterium]|jgi:hypothetical protein
MHKLRIVEKECGKKIVRRNEQENRYGDAAVTGKNKVLKDL